MFILSAGMPKSGSTLLSLYQRDILIAGRRDNGQLEFERQIMDGRISGIGIFVHELERSYILEDLVKLSSEIGPFVIKTHSSLTSGLRKHILNKDILVTYIHRDPRDVILSAIDHGSRPAGHPAWNPYFVQFRSVPESIPLVKEFCKAGMTWIKSGLCEVYTYKDLLTDPATAMDRFSRMISARPEESLTMELIGTYAVNAVKGKKQYNTGKLSRYHDEMSSEEITICNRELAEELAFLGYSVEGN